MNKLIPNIAFALLTGLTATNGISVMAGSCNSHMIKSAKIECAQDDAECQIERTGKIDLEQTSNS